MRTRFPLYLCSIFCFLSFKFVTLVDARPISTGEALSSLPTSNAKLPQLVIGVDGGTESIRACVFDSNGNVIGAPCAVPYTTSHPNVGCAEQNPNDWYTCLGSAVRGAVQSAKEVMKNEFEVAALCIDTTCCSVVALDEHNEPLMPCLLWMDQRSAEQAQYILETCRGDTALNVNCNGQGPLSAEWMTPKALWIHEQKPEIWKASKTICEYQDYINFKLTGVICASSCNAATRWHWDGDQCIKEAQDNEDPFPGRPMSLYQKLGIPELAEKLPQKCLPMGAIVGPTTEEATKHLGLSKPTTVVQGGADAFVGMIGLGCIKAGQLCLITGSSHLHCVVTNLPSTSPGTWGAYRGAPLPGINFVEGGQSSTGSLLRWARSSIIGAPDLPYAHLDSAAAAIEPGSNGLVALETFQGSRTPVTDPFARGALLGLTLGHTRAHVWRALLEAVCFGTRACVDALADAGHGCDEIVIAGGATRAPLWLQMHADVSGKPVVVCENTDAPLLGCAILACVGVGLHDTVETAVASMVRVSRRLEPNMLVAIEYDNLYKNVYSQVADAVRPVVHAMHKARRSTSVKRAVALSGGMTKMKRKLDLQGFTIAGDSENENEVGIGEESSGGLPGLAVEVEPIVSPSLLACDWSRIQAEVFRCLMAKASRLHVDIFDGVFLDSPMALTFGPQMVAAIRKSCNRAGDASSAVLDLHMCVDRPQRYVLPMAEAGGDRFVFQWEAMNSTEEAIELAIDIRTAGMACGVSLNPETGVEEVYSLLATNLVDLVDILAVDPGFGGQQFQRRVLDKIRRLRTWKEENQADFDIMVDGGVNDETAEDILAAGANILVSGSYVFQHKGGIKQAIKTLLNRGAEL